MSSMASPHEAISKLRSGGKKKYSAAAAESTIVTRAGPNPPNHAERPTAAKYTG
jgi:hypothetical protein